MGRIKDLNSSVPGETDNLVFDGLNGTKRISYADFKQKLIDDGFGSGSSEAVVLTQAEYDALPDEVKDSDTIFFISDAPFENSNVVTLTKAQYDALSDATKMDGRFYYVTDEEEVAKSLVVQENVNSTETVPSSAVLYAESADIKESLSTKTIAASDVFTPSAGWTLNSASYIKYDDYGNVEVYLHLTASPVATTGGRYALGTFSKYHPNYLIYSTAPTSRVNNGSLTDIVPVIFGVQPTIDNYTGQDVANIGVHLNYFTTNI